MLTLSEYVGKLVSEEELEDDLAIPLANLHRKPAYDINAMLKKA